MQTSAMKACFQIAECSFSSTKLQKKSDRVFHLITKFNIYNSDVTRAAAWWHQS